VKIVLYVEGSTEKAIPAFIKKWLDPKLPQPVTILPFADRKVHGAIGLIDFYGSGIGYRGDTIKDQYAWARQHLESQVNDVRFIQHFAVHETEAWLLSDPSIFPTAVAHFLPKTQQPETINSINPPASLLRDLYYRKLRKKYKKPVEGASLFGRLNPDVAYSRCPHLQLLLDDALALARRVV